jgi:hypothetical protein
VRYPVGGVDEIDVDASGPATAKSMVVELLKRDYEPGFLEPIRIVERHGWYL